MYIIYNAVIDLMVKLLALQSYRYLYTLFQAFYRVLTSCALCIVVLEQMHPTSFWFCCCPDNAIVLPSVGKFLKQNP